MRSKNSKNLEFPLLLKEIKMIVMWKELVKMQALLLLQVS